MDALSEILELIKLKSAVYFKSDFSAPWGMKINSGPYAQFHMVLKGKCILQIPNQNSIDLYAGDIVIFPFGNEHSIADTLDSRKEEGLKVVESIWNDKSLFTGNNFATTLICGHFEFDRNTKHAFVQSLPQYIHLADLDRREFSWLENISNLIIQESNAEQMGNSIAINKLAEVLFIHIIRAYILQNKEEKGFLAALKNSKLNTILKLVHSSPEKNWTLENLSTEAGMSRTLFANKFKEVVGETPLQYITNWRILKAKQFLAEGSESISEIAEKVGYSSEAAFNRVFKKKVLKTPAVFRRAYS